MQGFDFFPKTHSELSERTLSGALISLFSVLFVLWAGCHQLAECVRLRRSDRLVPQAGDSSEPLTLHLDLHFASLPCSEILIELTDAGGKEQLTFTDSLLKLRTDGEGKPIGMPAQLDFDARVAVGLRLSRFMHALHDALVGVLAFSLKAGCVRDYSQPCPDHWSLQQNGLPALLGRHRCEAPSWYFGQCNRASDFDGYTPEDKAEWSVGCQANWPCFNDAPRSNATGSPNAVEPVGESAFDVATARQIGGRMLARLNDAVANADIPSEEQGPPDFADIAAALRQDGDALRTMVDLAPVAVRAEVRPQLLTALAAIEVGERKARDETARHAALLRAAAMAAASSAAAAWRVAIRPTEALISRLNGMHAEDNASRHHAYESLRANLIAVLDEAREITQDESQATTLVTSIKEMIRAVDGLTGGAIGEDRRALELELEDRLSTMLHALGVMRDGRDGEGCALFGSIIMPHVAGNLRVVPAHSTAMEQNADVLGLLPSFSLRHALYFNVSHTIRHLSFGKFFPGKVHPLDGVEKTHLPGPAEVRYLLKVVACAYRSLSGEVTNSSLFSVTEHVRNLHWDSGPGSLPGVYFAYDISGQKVELTEHRGAGLLRGIARVCALVGGVFTVAGIIDSIVYRGVKSSLGKQS